MSMINKYRPKNWDELIGNNSLVASIFPVLQKRDSHAFLLFGPSGCGKTTIARLSAQELGTEDENLLEIDAATNNGIDDMRALIDTISYRPLRGDVKCIIIDECQAITAQAWKALLKSLEEPPPWVYWFLCTTEEGKVPANIKNRCSTYQVSPLPATLLMDLLKKICRLENKEVSKEIISLCARAAEGSPRRALAFLAMIDDHTLDEAKELIQQEVSQPEAVIDLAKFLTFTADPSQQSWDRLRILLKRLSDQNPESVRRIIESYIVKVMFDKKDRNEVRSLLQLLDSFSVPITTNSLTPIIQASIRWTLR